MRYLLIVASCLLCTVLVCEEVAFDPAIYNVADLRKHVLYRYIDGAANEVEKIAAMTQVKKMRAKDPTDLEMVDYQVICERIPYSSVSGRMSSIYRHILEDDYLQNYFDEIVQRYDPLLDDASEDRFRSEFFTYRKALSEITVVDPKTTYSVSATSYSAVTSPFSSLKVPLPAQMANEVTRISNNYGEYKLPNQSLANSEFDMFSKGLFLAINPLAGSSEAKNWINAGLGVSSFFSSTGVRFGLNMDLVKWYGLEYNNFYLIPMGLNMLFPIGNQGSSFNADFYYTGFRQKSKINRLPRYMDCNYRLNLSWKKVSFNPGWMIEEDQLYGEPSFYSYSLESPLFLQVGIQIPFNSSIDKKTNKDINPQTVYLNVGYCLPGSFEKE